MRPEQEYALVKETNNEILQETISQNVSDLTHETGSQGEFFTSTIKYLKREFEDKYQLSTQISKSTKLDRFPCEVCQKIIIGKVSDNYV